VSGVSRRRRFWRLGLVGGGAVNCIGVSGGAEIGALGVVGGSDVEHQVGRTLAGGRVGWRALVNDNCGGFSRKPFPFSGSALRCSGVPDFYKSL
jgi:hypothetical protein